MGSTRRLRLWHQAWMFAASLFLFVLFTPAAAWAAGEDGNPPPVSPSAAEQSLDPEDVEAPDAESDAAPASPEDPAPTSEEPSSEEPSSEEPSSEEPSSEEPSPIDVSTEDNSASGEPVTDELTEPTEPAGLAPSADLDTPADKQRGARAPEPKVTICHRTHDRTNPYNQITVTIPQAIGHAAEHEGPIYTPGGPRPWGDIIPPIPGLRDGQNWPEGRGILENGCEVEPDPGPLPDAAIGEVECDGAIPSLEVTVSNDPDATAPAIFTIFVDGDLVQAVGPIAPGDSQTVTLTGAGLQVRENQTFTVEVRSGGEVIASEVISVDCDPPPPPGVEITAELLCGGGGAAGNLAVTNNGPDPVTVTATVNGDPLGQPLVVGPGATETGTADLSQFEDQTVTVQVLVDGEVIATYTPTPDCDLAAVPAVKVAGLECPPPSATATLSNDGDPESTVVFTILVNGKVAQETAPLFGGDTTTIVGDLTPYEDQTVTIELRANGDVLGSRTIAVDCRTPAGSDVEPGSAAGPGGTQPSPTSNEVLPAVGAPFSPVVVAAGLGMVALGVLLILVANHPRRRV